MLSTVPKITANSGFPVIIWIISPFMDEVTVLLLGPFCDHHHNTMSKGFSFFLRAL